MADAATITPVDIRLPGYDPKKRKHFWIIMPSFKVSEDEIIAAHAGENVTIDPARIVKFPPPSCAYCEMFWIIVHNRPCLGDLQKQIEDHQRRERFTG